MLPSRGVLQLQGSFAASPLHLFECLSRRKRTGIVAEPDHLYVVTDMDFSALQHDAKNALVGEDTVAGEIVDGTAGVADFANLADFDEYFAAEFELRSQGEREQVDALVVKFSPKSPSCTSSPRACAVWIDSAAKKETWRCQCPACASEARPNCSITVSCPSATGDLRVPLCSDVLIETMRAGPL